MRNHGIFRLSLIASGVKEALQDAVVVVVNDNYANVYHGVREGYSGGYYTEGYGLRKRWIPEIFITTWMKRWEHGGREETG